MDDPADTGRTDGDLPGHMQPGGTSAGMPPVSAAVCPLARQGIRALDPEFAEAVREAGRMLAADGEQYRFLEVLTEEQDELKQLRNRLGGDSHV